MLHGPCCCAELKLGQSIMPVAGARTLRKIKKTPAGWMGGRLIRLTRSRLLGVLPPVLQGSIVMNLPTPKIAETFIHPSVKLRQADIGARCEILERSSVAYASLGDASYLGRDCQVADAEIGKFCAIAACVRIGPPNHPMGARRNIASPMCRNITMRQSSATPRFSRNAALHG